MRKHTMKRVPNSSTLPCLRACLVYKYPTLKLGKGACDTLVGEDLRMCTYQKSSNIYVNRQPPTGNHNHASQVNKGPPNVCAQPYSSYPGFERHFLRKINTLDLIRDHLKTKNKKQNPPINQSWFSGPTRSLYLYRNM